VKYWHKVGLLTAMEISNRQSTDIPAAPGNVEFVYLSVKCRI